MTSKLLVPCLRTLKDEIDGIWPGRPTASDGDIGDPRHQQEVSDHNDDEVGRVPIHDADSKHEVHALDITAFEQLPDIVRFVVGRCRMGRETRLRYIIFDRKIYQAANRWMPAAYNRADPHTGHAHFSSSYDTDKEADTSSWQLEEIPVALTDEDKKFIAATIKAEVAKLPDLTGKAVQNQKIGRTGRTLGATIEEIRAGVNTLSVADLTPPTPK